MDVLELTSLDPPLAQPRRGKRYDSRAPQTVEEERAWWLTPEAQARRLWVMTASYGPCEHDTPEEREQAIRAFFADANKLNLGERQPMDDDERDELQDMLATTLRHHRGNLTEWEEERFCEWLELVKRGRRLSDKQRAIVERVVEKTSRLVRNPKGQVNC